MYKNKDILESSENSPLPLCTIVTSSKVQMNVFFIAEFEREAKIRKIVIYCFLISLLVPEFKGLKMSSFRSNSARKSYQNQSCDIMCWTCLTFIWRTLSITFLIMIYNVQQTEKSVVPCFIWTPFKLWYVICYLVW